MDTYSCIEHINVENLNRLIRLGNIPDQTRNYLQNLKKHLKKESFHQVEFSTKKEQKIRNQSTGRMYPKRSHPSLQDCPKKLRGLLADQYSEIDVKNCFPTIFNHLFRQNNIECPMLHQYVSDRDGFIAQLEMNTELAKKAVGIVMNYGQFPQEPFITFGQEFRSAFEQLLEFDYYKKYKDFGASRAETDDPNEKYRKAVHYVGADVERACVTYAIEFFTDIGHDVSTIIHDGFLVKLQDVDEATVQDASDYVTQKTGVPITLAHKPLTYDLSVFDDEERSLEPTDKLTDAQACEIFSKYCFDMGYHFAKCNSDIYVYNPTTNLWSAKVDGWRTLCASCVELGEHGQSTAKQSLLWAQFIDKIPDNPDLLKEFHDQSFMKLAFNDGIYDFEHKKFTRFDDSSYLCGFIHKLKWNFVQDEDEEVIKEIYDKVIHGVFGEEQGDYLMAGLSRALAGYIYDKLMYIILGSTNSGKGVLSTLLENACDKYVGCFNSGVLCHKNVNDEAKGLSFLVPLKDKRIVIGNEASRSAVFDSQRINMMASGGDTICARQNNKDETEMKLACTVFLFCNDMSKINGLDDSVANRLRFLEPQFTFLAGMQYNKRKRQPNVREADDTIKTVFVKRPDVCAAFVSHLCHIFRTERPVEPASVVQQTNEWTEADDVIELLQGMFVYEEGSNVRVSDFFEACKRVPCLAHMSDNKIGRFMKNSCGVESSVKREARNKSMRFYLNIRLVVEYDDFL